METLIMCAALTAFIAAAALTVRLVSGLGEFELPDVPSDFEDWDPEQSPGLE